MTEPLRYPTARTVDQVDDYHGTKVADPYRWMEDLAAPHLAPWLDAQAELTERVLSGTRCRRRFRERLTELSSFAGVDIPHCAGGRWFQGRSPGGMSRGALYLLDSPEDDAGRVVFDLDAFDEDVVVSDVQPSPDGTKLLWCESQGGSDWRTWHVGDVDTGRRYDDAVRDAKLWAVWMPDGNSFLYIHFPSQGADATRATFNPQLRLHRLGDAQEDDDLVYENADNPTYFFPTVTDDGRYIVLTFLYAPGHALGYAPVEGPWSFTRILETDRELWFLGNRDDTFYIATTEGAPFGRVVAIDLAERTALRTVVAESDWPLPIVARAALVGDRIFVAREYLGRSRIELASLDGSSYEVELPGECHFVSAGVHEPVGSSPDARSLYFNVTSPTSPSTLLRHDVDSRETTVVSQPTGTPKLDITTEVVWTTSRDRTRVPMTIVRSGSDRNPPVVIEGYGGGGDSMAPYDFVAWKLAWLEAGGAVASAHIRGGGELGADWQATAARGGKLKAMQDFVACAEWLVSNGFTTPDRIAIQGRSSGAMLAAAAVIDSPQLFGACIAEVGMFDPLRYHLFGLGRLMIPEYGTSDDADDFKAMYAYSPLHNVKEGVRYPPFLLTVHTDDDRVAPGQPYKFAATLQSAQAGDAPILVRLRSGAGHHGGSMSGDIEERSDILAFLGLVLRVPGCG